jgi:hypothetical protein
MTLLVPGVKVSDGICVFSGTATPHALRRSEDDKFREVHSLVGDVYISTDSWTGIGLKKQCKQRIIIR